MNNNLSNYETIFFKIKPILHKISPDINIDNISMESLLINDLAIDSLKVAELSILLEDSFGKPFFVPDLIAKSENPYYVTVKTLVKYIAKSLGNSL